VTPPRRPEAVVGHEGSFVGLVGRGRAPWPGPFEPFYRKACLTASMRVPAPASTNGPRHLLNFILEALRANEQSEQSPSGGALLVCSQGVVRLGPTLCSFARSASAGSGRPFARFARLLAGHSPNRRNSRELLAELWKPSPTVKGRSPCLGDGLALSVAKPETRQFRALC
jgi:hypothetical protein